MTSMDAKFGQAGRAEALARYVGAFFDELSRGGVRDVVVSPGSRSTPLAMMAYSSALDVYVDVDERGAAFFALGLAKATGRAVALVCTSGTAVANYYPAVLEAESSRVPLIVLSGDRPARLQQLGAPQTVDQLKIFGDHVRRFWNMPELDGSPEQVRFARQIAREALAACEPHTLSSAPVHINFPFDEPLTPAYQLPDAFLCERGEGCAEMPVVVEGGSSLDDRALMQLSLLFANKRTIALCGEGTLGPFDASDPGCWEQREERARKLLAWAHRFDIPLLADPLSQLRDFSDAAIIDNYDNIFGREEIPAFDVVVRFGRYPVSKRVFKTLEEKPHIQIVFDPIDTRDFNAATTTLVKTDPVSFIDSFAETEAVSPASATEFNRSSSQLPSFQVDTEEGSAIAAWAAVNASERDLICSVEQASRITVCTSEGCHEEEVAYEGAYVQALLAGMPDKSLLFSANSMAIRALDTFYVKPDSGKKSAVQLGRSTKVGQPNSDSEQEANKRITVLANRGLNGIDGTLSSALGAAQAYEQAFFLTGDLTLLHDLNALALQDEFEARRKEGASAPSITIVLFNNGGGGIFERLPQRSGDLYFERLFLTPQKVDFEHAAKAFGVPYQQVNSLEEFRTTLASWQGEPGLHLAEVAFSLEGLNERFGVFQ